MIYTTNTNSICLTSYYKYSKNSCCFRHCYGIICMSQVRQLTDLIGCLTEWLDGLNTSSFFYWTMYCCLSTVRTPSSLLLYNWPLPICFEETVECFSAPLLSVPATFALVNVSEVVFLALTAKGKYRWVVDANTVQEYFLDSSLSFATSLSTAWSDLVKCELSTKSRNLYVNYFYTFM